MNRPAVAILIHMKLSTSRICLLGKVFRRRIRLTLKDVATPTVMGPVLTPHCPEATLSHRHLLVQSLRLETER